MANHTQTAESNQYKENNLEREKLITYKETKI